MRQHEEDDDGWEEGLVYFIPIESLMLPPISWEERRQQHIENRKIEEMCDKLWLEEIGIKL